MKRFLSATQRVVIDGLEKRISDLDAALANVGGGVDVSTLSNYATIDFVDNSIAKLDLGSKLSVGTFNTAKADLESALRQKADATNTYTKSEVDEKIAGVTRYKGVVDTRASLPTSGNKAGDVRIITDEDNMMVAWDGKKWDDISNADVDLTTYDTKIAQLESSLDSKVAQSDYNAKINTIETKANNALYKGANQVNGEVRFNSTNGTQNWIAWSMIDIEMMRMGRHSNGNFHMRIAGGTNNQLGNQILYIQNFKGGVSCETNLTITNGKSLTLSGVNVGTKLSELEANIQALQNSGGGGANNALIKGVNEFSTAGEFLSFKTTTNNTGYLSMKAGDVNMFNIGRVYGYDNFNLIFQGNTTATQTAQQKAVFVGFRGGLDVQQNLMVSNGGTLLVNGVDVMAKITALENRIAELEANS